MAEPLDGFFFHPDGGSPEAQLSRLIAGEHNPNFDNPFSTTFDEIDDEIKAAETERGKLLARLLTRRRSRRPLNGLRRQARSTLC
jgi:hypothetical protein